MVAKALEQITIGGKVIIYRSRMSLAEVATAPLVKAKPSQRVNQLFEGFWIFAPPYETLLFKNGSSMFLFKTDPQIFLL